MAEWNASEAGVSAGEAVLATASVRQQHGRRRRRDIGTVYCLGH